MRALIVATLIAFGVVAVSGLVLSFRYFPETAGDGTTLSDILRPIHELSAYVTLGLVAVLAASALARVSHGTWRSITLVVGGAAIALAALVFGIVRGPRLAWDQLALFAVTNGRTGPRGVWLPDTVRFVLRGVAEVSVGDYRRDVWVHVLVTPTLVIIGVAMLLHALRPRAAAQRAPSGSATNVISSSS